MREVDLSRGVIAYDWSFVITAESRLNSERGGSETEKRCGRL